MAAATESGSAKIYQFPARGRYASASVSADSMLTNGYTLTRIARTACGSSWYHEEAIREAADEIRQK